MSYGKNNMYIFFIENVCVKYDAAGILVIFSVNPSVVIVLHYVYHNAKYTVEII